MIKASRGGALRVVVEMPPELDIASRVQSADGGFLREVSRSQGTRTAGWKVYPEKAGTPLTAVFDLPAHGT